MARQGTARQVNASTRATGGNSGDFLARPGEAGLGEARRGAVGLGVARRGVARPGKPWQLRAPLAENAADFWRGGAWRGGAWRGCAGLGEARKGNATTRHAGG